MDYNEFKIYWDTKIGHVEADDSYNKKMEEHFMAVQTLFTKPLN